MVRGALLILIARCAELRHLGTARSAAGVRQRRERDPARQAQVRNLAHGTHALLCHVSAWHVCDNGKKTCL